MLLFVFGLAEMLCAYSATLSFAFAALREGRWTPLSSEDLLPGDIIAIARAEGRGTYTYNGALAEVEATCPADVVMSCSGHITEPLVTSLAQYWWCRTLTNCAPTPARAHADTCRCCYTGR